MRSATRTWPVWPTSAASATRNSSRSLICFLCPRNRRYGSILFLSSPCVCICPHLSVINFNLSSFSSFIILEPRSPITKYSKYRVSPKWPIRIRDILTFSTLKSRYHAYSLYYLDYIYDVNNKIYKTEYNIIFKGHK